MFPVRIILICLGLLWVLLHEWMGAMGETWQTVVFLAGILTLGVPHGAADLLVEMRNRGNAAFPVASFLGRYLTRLVLFALLLFLFPTLGLLVFILIAAYHFGETDLSRLDASGWSGKSAVLTHGLSVLGIILLGHAGELKPYFSLVGTGRIDWVSALSWLERHSLSLMMGLILIAVATMWFHCRRHPGEWRRAGAHWAAFYAPIAFILWQLPLLEGFTFYFIGWHSVLSLDCIVGYLCRSGAFSRRKVTGQIALFSALAIVGIMGVGWAGFMFASPTSMAWYVFMGLAVLTAPHMEVMHDMYHRLRVGSRAPSPPRGLAQG
jgi:Brp/Blh family beta-carotene 15,15'-monooxygenase